MKKAIVIIPTYNEQDVIEQTVISIINECANIADFSIEILIFDSNSSDQTISIIQCLQVQYSQLHLMTEPQKSGLGSAYMQAMQYAVEMLEADIVFEFDADGSHQPKYIPKLLQEIEQGADVVIGSRYVKGGSIPKDWGLHRKFLSVIGNLVARVFLSPKRKDWTSGFRATRSDVLQKVTYTKLFSRSYAYKLHLFWMLHKVKANIVEYPIAFIDREQGYSKLPKNNMIESLKLVIWLRVLEMKSYIKVCLVGVAGMVLQFVTFNIFRHFFAPQYATAIATEISIVSNFLLNNAYTFKRNRLSRSSHGYVGIFKKAIHFNLVSLGSLLIQFLVMLVGVHWFGRGLIAENIFMIIGIGLASFSNYFTYSRFIWQKEA